MATLHKWAKGRQMGRWNFHRPPRLYATCGPMPLPHPMWGLKNRASDHALLPLSLVAGSLTSGSLLPVVSLCATAALRAWLEQKKGVERTSLMPDCSMPNKTPSVEWVGERTHPNKTQTTCEQGSRHQVSLCLIIFHISHVIPE